MASQNRLKQRCHGYIYTVKMVIKIKLKGLIVYLCRHLLVQSQQLKHCKPCSKLTMETPKRHQRHHSVVSIINSDANS